MQKKQLEIFLLQNGGTFEVHPVWGNIYYQDVMKVDLFPLKISVGYDEKKSTDESFAVIYPQEIHILGRTFFVMNDDDLWNYLKALAKMNEQFGNRKEIQHV